MSAVNYYIILLFIICYISSYITCNDITIYNNINNNNNTYNLTRYRRKHNSSYSSNTHNNGKHDHKYKHIDNTNAVHNDLTQPDWTVYHTADEIYNIINDIAQRNNDIIKVTTPYQHHDKWSSHPYSSQLQLVEITNLNSHISDNNKLHIQLTFGEHGREIISSEIALILIQLFDIDSHINIKQDDSLSNDYRTFLLDHVHFYIIPLLNIWSHKQVEQGYVCERKNMNSVDSNRNFDYMFRTTNDNDKLIHMSNDQYPGIEPFSEMESQYIRDIGQLIIDRHNTHDLYINVHSGVREMYRYVNNIQYNIYICFTLYCICSIYVYNILMICFKTHHSHLAE